MGECIRQGFLLDTDFWQLVQDFHGDISFGGICTLVQEVQLRKRYDSCLPGRLSLREFAVLIFPSDSKEYQVLRPCSSDNEAKDFLYLLQHSEACPKCGVHIQRDFEASACPEVSCPICRTSFRCTRAQIFAQAQMFGAFRCRPDSNSELERDRLRLAQLLGHDATVLSDVFSFLAQGRRSFTLPDLRRALSHLHLQLSERDLKLIWNRYAPHGHAPSNTKL
eukprot:g24460.t1